MYAKVINGEVETFPYTIQNLYDDNPNVCFPSILTDGILDKYNTVRVVVTGEPEYDKIKYKVDKVTAVYNANRYRWETSWSLVEKTQEEYDTDTANEAVNVRIKRNNLISACDWTQLPDSPVNKDVWASYRQFLRDITKQEGFPWSITWPTEP